MILLVRVLKRAAFVKPSEKGACVCMLFFFAKFYHSRIYVYSAFSNEKKTISHDKKDSRSNFSFPHTAFANSTDKKAIPITNHCETPETTC